MKNLLRSIGLALVLGTLVPALPGCGGSSADTGDEQDQTAAAGRFETFVGADGQHYFHLLAGNGEKMLHSEGYTSLSSAKKGIASVKKNAQVAKNFKVLETASNGEFYFNLVAGNGQIIGTSETYVSKSNATRAVDAVVKMLTTTTDAAAPTGDAKFETFTGQDTKTYFRLRAGNGEIVLQSQGYSSKSSADKGITSVKKNGLDLTNFEILEAQNGQFYFHLVAANGQVIGRGEIYTSKSNADRGAKTVSDLLRGLSGTSAPTDAEIKTQIEKAADGFFFMSEGDFPFTYVNATLSSSEKITEALVRKKLASFVDNDEDADKPLASLVSMTQTWAEWTSGDATCSQEPDEDLQVLCAQQAELNRVIGSNLTDVQVFFFGSKGKTGNVEGTAVSIFIVGRTPSGSLAGVRTIAIWT